MLTILRLVCTWYVFVLFHVLNTYYNTYNLVQPPHTLGVASTKVRVAGVPQHVVIPSKEQIYQLNPAICRATNNAYRLA